MCGFKNDDGDFNQDPYHLRLIPNVLYDFPKINQHKV